MRKTLSLLSMLLLVFSLSYAQQHTVAGTVSGPEGAPISAATILVKGTNKSTLTDKNGKFEIMAEPGQTLSVTYVGLEGKDVPVTRASSLSVELNTSAASSELDQVVVVGYGTKKKVNLTGAVSTVSSKELEGRPITNLSSALQGTMSGVTVTVNNGQPGNDQGTIRVRGIGTLGNSDAMVLVDGIVSSMDDINPGDIESVTVLKDAASASIYGSRAANGVILITTKAGRKGEVRGALQHGHRQAVNDCYS